MTHYSIEDFENCGSLGRGAFGHVTKVVNRTTGEIFGMKALSKQRLVEQGMMVYLAREVKTQLSLRHPNILRLHYYFEDEETMRLLLEFAEGGSLFEHLKKQGMLPQPEAAGYFVDVASGLAHLHWKGLIHRDVKPENALLCHSGTAKLADFGWCAEVSPTEEVRKTFCGTWDYMSPEMVQSESHDFKVDVWAVGVLLYEMLTCEAPFRSANRMKAMTRIAEVDLQFPDFFPDMAKDLVQKLLVKEPDRRLGLACAMEHKWVHACLEREWAQPEARLPIEAAGDSSHGPGPVATLLPASELTPSSTRREAAAEPAEGLLKRGCQKGIVKKLREVSSRSAASPVDAASHPALMQSCSCSTAPPPEEALRSGTPSRASSVSFTFALGQDSPYGSVMRDESPGGCDGKPSLAHMGSIAGFRPALDSADCDSHRILSPLRREEPDARYGRPSAEPARPRPKALASPAARATRSAPEPPRPGSSASDSALPAPTAGLLKALNSPHASAALRLAKIRSEKNRSKTFDALPQLGEVDTTSSTASASSQGSETPDSQTRAERSPSAPVKMGRRVSDGAIRYQSRAW